VTDLAAVDGVPADDGRVPAPTDVVPAAAEAQTKSALPAGGVVLRLDHGTYVADLANVAEVTPVPGITPLPGHPEWLCGVANWRGRVLAVVDVRPLLGLESHPQTSASRLVILTADGVEVAVLADAVTGVAERPGPARPVPVASAGLLSAVCTIDSGPASVLDAAAVVALRRQLAPAA
jgi:chemotaxis signal transduction protein